MPSKMRYGFLITIAVFALLFVSVILSYAETVTFVYDDLHRLIQVDYGSGVRIVYTYDQYGNRTGQIVSDTGAPTTTADPPGGIYNATVQVALNCSDGYGLGCQNTYYTTNGQNWFAYTSPIPISAPTTLSFYSIDFANNTESPPKTAVYSFDYTPPTGSIIINGGAALTNSMSVTLTLSCSDANGCSQMQFSNDNVTYSTPEPYATSKAWGMSSGDGTKSVYAKFKDTAGNWSVSYNDTIQLDATPPTTTASPTGGVYGTAQTVTLTCSDGSGSGCDKIYYSTDGSTPTTLYSSPINISVSTTLKFFAKDIATNSEAVKTENYIIDTVPPTGTIIIDSGAAFTMSTGVTLTLSCSDNVACSQMQFSNDNSTYSTPEAYTTTKAWTLTSGNGTKTVYVKYMDTVGNLSTAFSDTIVLNTSCSSSPAKIGSTSYATIQAAYNAAANGDTIKCLGKRITENLTINRNIAVTLEGGYDCGFTTNTGNTTPLKGMITTTAGGGTITIKNFVLEN
jgi:YD repeat-containing protein